MKISTDSLIDFIRKSINTFSRHSLNVERDRKKVENEHTTNSQLFGNVKQEGNSRAFELVAYIAEKTYA